MRYIFLLLAIFMSINCSYAGLFTNRHSTFYQNGYNTYNPYQHDLTRLERRIFNQTFDYDSQNARIERLERKIFGACQSGSLDERLNLLKNAGQNYKTYSTHPYTTSQYNRPIFTGTAGSNWRNMVLGNFMNQFAGTATGFTPTLTPVMDPAFMDYFEAERAGYGDNFDYADNHRRIYNRTNRTSGTRVQMLD